MKPPGDPLRFIRTVHRHARWRALVWALAFMLLGFGCVRADTLGWWPDGYLAGFGAACIATAILVRWLKRERGLTAAATARELDARWKLQARIETAWELAESKTELAQAQRQDVAHHLADRREPGAIMSHLGVAMLTLSVLLLTTLTIVGPKPPPVVARQQTPVAPSATNEAVVGPDTGEIPQEPAPDMAEEKPLVETPPPVEPEKPEDTFAEIAWLAPTSGIKATAIEEIALAADVVTRSGFAKLTLEITVNGTPRPAPALPPEALKALAAPADTRVDFPLYLDELELKPFDVVGYFLRADPVARRPVPAVVSPVQFIEIKPLERGEDQVREPPPLDPFRDREPPTLPERKTTLAGQLEELAQKQSELAQQIGRIGKAGSVVERYSGDAASADDPAALVEPQGLVAHRAGQIAKSKKLADEATAAVKQAAREATAAVECLAKNDVSPALPRASEAARYLQEAVFQQERAGRAMAVAILEDARRRFNAAARAATAEERARQVGEAIDRLANAALEQQTTGSEKAAAELAEVARAYQVALHELRSLKNQAAAKEPSEPAAWQAAELRAAQAQLALSSESEMLGLTLRQLQRAKHLLARSGMGADIWVLTERAIEDSELALQMAQVLIIHHGLIPARGIRRTVTNERWQAIMDFYRKKYFVAAPEFEAALNSLEELLAEAPVENKRDERVRAFNPDEIDPEYRAPVENYFEQLSGKKPRK